MHLYLFDMRSPLRLALSDVLPSYGGMESTQHTGRTERPAFPIALFLLQARCQSQLFLPGGLEMCHAGGTAVYASLMEISNPAGTGSCKPLCKEVVSSNFTMLAAPVGD